MGLGGLHIWHLLIILGIVIVIFGTKRLKTLGSDLGGAIKNFKDSMKAEQEGGKPEDDAEAKKLESRVVEGKVTAKKTEKKKV